MKFAFFDLMFEAGSANVAQAGLELENQLSQIPKCLDDVTIFGYIPKLGLYIIWLFTQFFHMVKASPV